MTKTPSLATNFTKSNIVKDLIKYEDSKKYVSWFFQHIQVFSYESNDLRALTTSNSD